MYLFDKIYKNEFMKKAKEILDSFSNDAYNSNDFSIFCQTNFDALETDSKSVDILSYKKKLHNIEEDNTDIDDFLVDFSQLFNMVKISKKFSLQAAIAFCNELIATQSESIYGFFLYNEEEKILFNPYAPLVPQEICDDPFSKLHRVNYQIILYSYTKTVLEDKEGFNMLFFENPSMENLYNSFCEKYVQDRAEYILPKNLSQVIRRDILTDIQYILNTKVTKYIGSRIFDSLKEYDNLFTSVKQDKVTNSLLVPVHTLSHQLKYPYYGLLLVDQRYGTGKDLTPFLTGNLHTKIESNMNIREYVTYEDTDGNEYTLEEFMNKASITIEDNSEGTLHTDTLKQDLKIVYPFTSSPKDKNYFPYPISIEQKTLQDICTGSLSNTSLQGIRTLNHANLNDAFHHITFTSGWIHFTQICLEKGAKYYEQNL